MQPRFIESYRGSHIQKTYGAYGKKGNEFKSFKEISIPVGESVKPVTNRERIKIYEERGTGRVVDDPRLEVKWKPIDKIAARVVAPR